MACPRCESESVNKDGTTPLGASGSDARTVAGASLDVRTQHSPADAREPSRVRMVM
jgi:hypothetical protein